jgi:thioredoxin-related protein
LQVVLNNGKKIDLSHPNKKIFLVFYSSMCIPCKYILTGISKDYRNKDYDDIEIIYITKDSFEDINILNKSLNMPLSLVKNANELFDEFDVSAVPVTMQINIKGQIVERIEGANSNWSLKENLK